MNAGSIIDDLLRDLEPCIRAAQVKFSAALGGRPSKQQILSWLRQFREPRWIELAASLLGHVRIFTRTQVSALIVDRLRAASSDGRHLFCPLGALRDGASALPYELGKVLKLGIGTLRLLESNTVPDFRPDRIWLLDDAIGEGEQAMKMLRAWFGVSRNPKYPTLGEETLEMLRSTPITIVAAVGLHRGAKAIMEQAANVLGLDVRVDLAKELDDRGCFDPEVFPHDAERAEVRLMAETIGAQLVAPYAQEHGLSEEERKWDALGFGGAAQLVVLEKNTPNFSLPILWADGVYDGQPWRALFPYRKTQ